MKKEVIKPFGPSIGKYVLSQDLTDELFSICTPNNPPANKSLVGLVSEENNILPTLKESTILPQIKNIALDYVNSIDSGLYKPIVPLVSGHLAFAGAWYNNQKIYEHNPVHNHVGHSIVIVVFPYVDISTKIPLIRNDDDEAGKLVFNFNGTLNDGFGQTFYSVSPKTGNAYVFPANLLHSTLPIYSNYDTRYSISFNLIFTEKARKDLAKIT